MVAEAQCRELWSSRGTEEGWNSVVDPGEVRSHRAGRVRAVGQVVE